MNIVLVGLLARAAGVVHRIEPFGVVELELALADLLRPLSIVLHHHIQCTAKSLTLLDTFNATNLSHSVRMARFLSCMRSHR